MSAASLTINEIMASNSQTLADAQGQYDDWIELVNLSDRAVDVGGMYLTDDPDNPTMWRFPQDNALVTTIAAHGYLVVWLDNDTDREGLHAGFKLDAQGEAVALFAADGVTLVDQISFGVQEPDIAFGRFPDGSPDWTLMGTPTPGAENIKTYSGFAEAVRFSQEREFYEEPISISLSTPTDGAAIYYTLDGKNPGIFHVGRYEQVVGDIYVEPIPITTTTCVRAVAVKPGWQSSRSVSHTYFFLEDVAGQPIHPKGFPFAWESITADYEMDPDIVNDPQYADRIVTA